jgi:hypothetical protein
MAVCVEDLEPDLEIRVTNENGRILLGDFSWVVQEPALIWTRVFDIETCIEAFDKIPGETIVDPRAIIFAKDDPGFASGIPNDVLPISSGAGDRGSSVTMGSWLLLVRRSVGELTLAR